MRDRRRTVPVPAGTPRRHPARAFTRRRMLAATVALPPALAACSPGAQRQDGATEALLALADAARMDAAMAVAAVTADPALAGQLEPLRAARMEHAAALDQAGGRAPGSAPTAANPPSADLAAVRDSVAAAARTAGEVVPQASALQVGLVAEVAACCATYAAVLQ